MRPCLFALFGAGCGRVPSLDAPPPTGDSALDTGEDCGVVDLEGVLTADRELRAGCPYRLTGRFDIGDPLAIGGLGPPVTLTVAPGTVVSAEAGTRARLLVHRTGRLVAEGTTDAPIVFTSSSDRPVPGDWGGVVITGTAQTNLGGIGVLPEQGVFGGGDDDHDGGALAYVRIEWAGASIGGGTRMAGLGLYGAGRATRLRGIQVHGAAGDGVVLRGGTASLVELLVTGAGDRGVVYADGWRGTGQRWIVQQGPGVGSHGLEGSSSEQARLPASSPTLTQVTLIGQGAPGGANAYDIGLWLRDGTGGQLANLVIVGFDGSDVAVDATVRQAAEQGDLTVEVGRLGSAVPFGLPELATLPVGFVDVGATDLSGVVAGLQSVEAPRFCTDFIGAVPIDGARIEPSDVIGACGPDDDWTKGWSTRSGGGG